MLFLAALLHDLLLLEIDDQAQSVANLRTGGSLFLAGLHKVMEPAIIAEAELGRVALRWKPEESCD